MNEIDRSTTALIKMKGGEWVVGGCALARGGSMELPANTVGKP